MKVRATKLGYYGDKRRKEGEIFTISEDRHFSKLWMERVDGAQPKPKPAPAPEAKPSVAQESSEEVI